MTNWATDIQLNLGLEIDENLAGQAEAGIQHLCSLYGGVDNVLQVLEHRYTGQQWLRFNVPWHNEVRDVWFHDYRSVLAPAEGLRQFMPSGEFDPGLFLAGLWRVAKEIRETKGPTTVLPRSLAWHLTHIREDIVQRMFESLSRYSPVAKVLAWRERGYVTLWIPDIRSGRRFYCTLDDKRSRPVQRAAERLSGLPYRVWARTLRLHQLFGDDLLRVDLHAIVAMHRVAQSCTGLRTEIPDKDVWHALTARRSQQARYDVSDHRRTQWIDDELERLRQRHRALLGLTPTDQPEADPTSLARARRRCLQALGARLFKCAAVDALLLTDATVAEIAEATGIAPKRIGARYQALKTGGVLADGLSRGAYRLQLQRAIPQLSDFLGQAKPVNGEYLLWLLTGQRPKRPAEFLKSLWVDALFQAAGKGPSVFDLTSSGLEWARVAEEAREVWELAAKV